MPYSQAIEYPFVFRGAVSTGSATLTRAQEGTILAAIAGVFQDVTQVGMSNTSTAAISVQLRSLVAGGVEDTIVVPAASTIQIPYVPPLPMGNQGNAWTAQVTGTSDQSDSPITVTLRAIQNVP